MYLSVSLAKKLFLYLTEDPASVDVEPVPYEALSEVGLCLQHGLEHSSLYDYPGKIVHYYGMSREEGTWSMELLAV